MEMIQELRLVESHLEIVPQSSLPRPLCSSSYMLCRIIIIFHSGSPRTKTRAPGQSGRQALEIKSSFSLGLLAGCLSYLLATSYQCNREIRRKKGLDSQQNTTTTPRRRTTTTENEQKKKERFLCRRSFFCLLPRRKWYFDTEIRAGMVDYMLFVFRFT